MALGLAAGFFGVGEGLELLNPDELREALAAFSGWTKPELDEEVVSMLLLTTFLSCAW